MQIETAFAQAMAAAGIVTDDPIIPDGVLHRIHVEGHRRGSKNGAYLLHGDSSPAGWWMDFVTGTSGTWSASGRFRLDDATRRQIEIAKAQRKAEQMAKAAGTTIGGPQPAKK